MFNRRVVAYLAISTASVGAFVPLAQQQNHHQSLLSTTTTTLQAATVETPPSPLTAWGEKITDIRSAQNELKKQTLPEFGPEISASDVGIASDDIDAQLTYFKENATDLKRKMEDHGAIVFRGFDLMKKQEGFQQFYAALGMKVCQDPLQSVSARPTADGKKDSPVYEAVNKESRKNFFIGK
jgi:hypothetical protein